MRRRGGSAPPDDLAAFYADQYDRVRGSLTLFTGDRQLAEELAQEAFVKVCQHWERVRAMDAPGAWVHRVGINLAISRARRHRTEVRVVQRVGAEGRPVAEGPDAAGADGALMAALAALPDDERAVLVLRYYADLPVAAAATALRIAEGTVKTRTRRALARLRADGLAGPCDLDDEVADDDAEVRGARTDGDGGEPAAGGVGDGDGQYRGLPRPDEEETAR